MPKVRLLRKPGAAGNDGNPYPEVGTVFEVDEDKARALCAFHYAKRVEDEDAEKPADSDSSDADADSKPEGDTADTRETKTDADAEKRETREVSAKEVRAWAQSNDVDVPARGAIPAEVREKFDAAHAEN